MSSPNSYFKQYSNEQEIANKLFDTHYLSSISKEFKKEKSSVFKKNSTTLISHYFDDLESQSALSIYRIDKEDVDSSSIMKLDTPDFPGNNVDEVLSENVIFEGKNLNIGSKFIKHRNKYNGKKGSKVCRRYFIKPIQILKMKKLIQNLIEKDTKLLEELSYYK